MKLFLAISTILFTFHNVNAVFVVKEGATYILECGTQKLEVDLWGLTFTNEGQVNGMVMGYKPLEQNTTPFQDNVETLARELIQSASHNNSVVLRIRMGTIDIYDNNSSPVGQIWQESFYGTGTFTFVATSRACDVPAHVKLEIQLGSQKTIVGKEKVNSASDQLKDAYWEKVYPTTPPASGKQSFVCFDRITVDRTLLWFMGDNHIEYDQVRFTYEHYFVGDHKKQLTLFTAG